MTPEATVRTEDLGMAIDWLEGLATLLYELHQERRGADRDAGRDLLIEKLSTDLIDHHGVWQPLGYQAGVGMGWYYLAHNVEELRGQLVERYGNAAL